MGERAYPASIGRAPSDMLVVRGARLPRRSGVRESGRTSLSRADRRVSGTGAAAGVAEKGGPRSSRRFILGRFPLWLTIAVLGTGSLLSACGQKGALYRPDHKTEQQGQQPPSH